MAERSPEIEALRTQDAQKLMSLADEVTESFVDYKIAGGAYVVELLAPEGISMEGGKHALQHLRLRAIKAGKAAIVAGSVNPIEKHAEIRTFEHAFLVHQIRFGATFEVSKSEWEQLLKRLEAVLAAANIESVRVGPPPDVLRDSRRQKAASRTSPLAIAIFVIITLLALFVIVRVVQKLHG